MKKQIFDIETSLQYIDDVKKSLTQKQTLDNLSHQLEQTKQLKKINFFYTNHPTL